MAQPKFDRPKTIELIATQLEEGIPLAEICRQEGMPNTATVWKWEEEDESLKQRIARARKIGFDAIAANTRKIARGEEGFSSGDVQRDKMMIDTDLKLLSKWDSGRYGERVTQEHTGPGGGPIQTITRKIVDPAAHDGKKS